MELQCVNARAIMVPIWLLVNAEKLVLTYLPNHRISELKQQNHPIRRLLFSSAGSRP